MNSLNRCNNIAFPPVYPICNRNLTFGKGCFFQQVLSKRNGGCVAKCPDNNCLNKQPKRQIHLKLRTDIPKLNSMKNLLIRCPNYNKGKVFYF